ncbi:MAG TPA: fructosamine kinase family protein [Tepidisphaeraceae bacterium]|jgi:fructosamine-3-kinase
MSIGEIDISWDSLRRIVQDWAGTSAELAEFEPLVGGCINTTLLLKLKDGAKAVLKLNPYRVDISYQREATQLALLKSLSIPVPEVYKWKIGTLDDPISYLLIEFMEGVDFAHAKTCCNADEFDHLQRHLAEIILAMHEQTNSQYMRIMEGGQGFDNWCGFYRHVYDPILNEVEKHPLLPKGCRKTLHKIHEKFDRLIAHGDKPRLVHWDIWATNLLARQDASGKWRLSALLDPNCKYAHAEAEIAYMQLFNTVTPAFMQAYQQVHKLTSDYHNYRKPIYQLYPLLNHLRLFGHEYVKPVAAAVERCAALV